MVMKSKDCKISKIVRMLMMLLTVIPIALFLTIMILVSKIQGTARVVKLCRPGPGKDPADHQAGGCKKNRRMR